MLWKGNGNITINLKARVQRKRSLPCRNQPEYVTRMFEPALIWGSRWQCQPDTALWHPCLKPKAAKTLHQVTQRKRYDLKFLLHQFFCGPIFDHPEIKLIYFLRHKSSGKSKRPLQKHAADRTLALPLQEFLYPDIN